MLSKSSTVEQVLDRIPAVDFNGGISQSSNNGGGGLSEVSLRNLGPARTLVLIDGQRVIPNGGAVDYNSIPLALVDHVEVLKDGASSIYGADAIAGVVNIITKKNFEGVDFNANYGESGHGDGAQYGISGTMGVKNDRGNLIIGMGWDVQNPINQSDRAWGTDLHANDPNYPGGSAWRTQLDVLQNENSPNQIWIGAPNSNAVSSATNPAVAGQAPNLGYITALGKVKLDSGGVGWSTITTGRDRKQLNFKGRYDLTSNITAVLEGFYTNYTASQKLRPEPLLGDTIATPEYAGFIIPATNPYNLTGSDLTAYLTPAQFGPRIYDESTNTYRLRAGLEGTFFDNFKWEAGYVFQATDFKEIVHNEGNWDHLAQLTGQVPCVDVPGGCTNGLPTTPINFFNGPNIFTPAQVAYATFNNTQTESSYERYLYADVSGTLINLPAGPLKGALGLESREEHLEVNPDSLAQAGLTANPTGPTAGGYQVSSIYGEVNAPILRDLPFVQSLNFSGSARFDDYSNFGGEVTYKVGLNWEVSRDIRFRSSYATAIRAPQVAELFGGQGISDNGASGDPCETNPAYNANGNFGKGVLTPGSTCAKAAAAAHQSLSTFTDALDAIPNNQQQVLTGGNPNLQPEKARITSGGVIITPRWVPGLSIATDYYSIIISNTVLVGGIVGSAGADLVLNGCYGPAQNQSFCDLITRDSHGNIVQINSLNANVGVQTVEGWDYEISYSTRAAHLKLPVPGYFSVDLNIDNQIKSTQTNPDGSVSNFNGYFNVNNETNQPRWKGIFTADYALSRFHFRYDLRYTQHTFDLNGGANVYGNEVPDMAYHDIAVSYDLPHVASLHQAQLIFGIDNLADKDPPFIGSDSICKCNTIAGPFDVVGRFFYSRLSTHF